MNMGAEHEKGAKMPDDHRSSMINAAHDYLAAKDERKGLEARSAQSNVHGGEKLPGKAGETYREVGNERTRVKRLLDDFSDK